MIKQFWRRLVGVGFRLLYNEMAWTYDLVSWLVSLGSWRAWQRAALPFISGRHVLEIGHGPGHMLMELYHDGFAVVGLDLSSHMVRQARRRAQQAGVSIPVVQGQVQALPFKQDTFDSVLATFPTEYVVDPATVAAVYRVLQPGGRFVIVPEGHLTGSGLLHRFIHWLFHLTGQREGPFAVDETELWPNETLWQPFKQRFLSVGFQMEIKQIPLEGSGVTVIIAHKPGG